MRTGASINGYVVWLSSMTFSLITLIGLCSLLCTLGEVIYALLSFFLASPIAGWGLTSLARTVIRSSTAWFYSSFVLLWPMSFLVLSSLLSCMFTYLSASLTTHCSTSLILLRHYNPYYYPFILSFLLSSYFHSPYPSSFHSIPKNWPLYPCVKF